jgi:ferredoxin
MLYITIAGWLELALVVVLVGLFTLDALAERQWRAALVALVLPAPLVAVLAALLLVDVPLGAWLLAANVVATALGALALTLPYDRGEPLRRAAQPGRVDERDALFHRFYRLQPGTPEFEQWYAEHPDLRELDDEIRAMPQLASPGARTWDPIAAPAMRALDEVTDELAGGRSDDPRPLAGTAPLDPGQAASQLIGFARYLGADLAGCAPLDPAWIYSHVGRGEGPFGAPIELDHGHAIAIAVRMDHDMIRHAPFLPSATETTRCYLEVTRVARALERYVQLLGYRARAHVPGNYQVMCVPVAADAGLGELGRLGLLITRRFGPRIRLAVVTTDLPLAPSPPARFGVQHLCTHCLKCADICPSRSIDRGPPREHNGVIKWQSERDECYRFWRTCGSDCGLCIKVCPYAHPASWSHDLVRRITAANPLARRLAVWADDLAYGRRPRRRFPVPRWLRRGTGRR